MTTWDAITARSLAEIDAADPLYRPTNFWQPGLQQLLADMDQIGLPRFKSWPTAAYWFYPTYGANLTPETTTAAVARAIELSCAKYCSVGVTLAAGTVEVRNRYRIRQPDGTEITGEVAPAGPGMAPEVLAARV